MPNRFSNIPRIELRAAMISLVTSLVLLGLKFSAYWLTDSSAIFSDALESIVNVLAAFLALWALAIAHTPADEEHPYGHGKVEFMSAALEGGMILLASVVILFQAGRAFFGGGIEAGNVDEGLILIGVAMIINGVVGYMLIRIGRRQSSATLEADGHHLLSDAVTSVAVLIGLGIVYFTGFKWADPICAILIAIYIAWVGLKLVKRSMAGLMDAQDADDNRRLIEVLDSHCGSNATEPRICSYHKLRHRHNGRYHWVDFHIMIPAGLSIARGHEIASTIEYEIECLLGEGNATAHVEPCNDATCADCVAELQIQQN